MNKSLLVFALVFFGLMTLFALPVAAQGNVNPEGATVLDQAPESVFVFHLSPTQANVGDNVWVLYAWGYLGEPAQTLTITTSFPAGVDPRKLSRWVRSGSSLGARSLRRSRDELLHAGAGN